MITTGTITRQGFEVALKAARDEGTVSGYSGLSAALDGGWLGKISAAWEAIENALRDAFVHGVEFGRETLDAAIREADDLIRTAGARARDVHQALLAKIQTYIAGLIDAALGQVRRTLQVGEVRLDLEGVQVAQTVSMTGSIKASLTEIVALTSAGELSITANYKLAPPSPGVM